MTREWIPYRIWRRNAVGAWYTLYRSIEARIRWCLSIAHHHYPKFVSHRSTGNTSAAGRAA